MRRELCPREASHSHACVHFPPPPPPPPQDGKHEILFCGPDENTADLMDWACEHARHRGYPFWKSFTTGKAPRLGGVPHDVCVHSSRSGRRWSACAAYF
jgi:NAD-specific glutamate dehydrogenase